MDRIRDELGSAGQLTDLEKLRVSYIGKKGVLTQQLKRIGSLHPNSALGLEMPSTKRKEPLRH